MMKLPSTLLVLTPLLCAACDPSEGGAIDFSDIFGGHHDHAGPSDPHDPPEPPGTGGAGGGTAPAELLQAVAMTRAQRDALSDAYWEEVEAETGSAVAGGGFENELDPNDLILDVSDTAVLGCDIYPVGLPCGGHWRLSFTLPVAYQQVGVYNLDDPAIFGFVTATGEPYTPASDSCGGGGGTFIGSGTLEILAIDSAEVRFRLIAESALLDVDVSEEYTAPRCP